ncbi:Sorting nexin-7 [Stylophora pistillata]|uniref:Sorting nexin-7 n=1 Tax=Stylophora pistillata TaxID=50429 RepID=A0A2B4SX86_STYPI|nr:Sorting nexin-7 [Stylophora pistillata]
MSSKFPSRKKNNRQPRLLQALRDFTAADTCYSDGANPLSFQIGEIFTFLSRRDNYWVNVERTVWRHNPLLKTKEYLTVERGIVPVAYIIEMDIKENEGMSSHKEEECPVPNGDHDEASHVNIFKRFFNLWLLQTIRHVYDYFGGNGSYGKIPTKYYAVGETMVSTKEELEIAQQSLIEEQQRSRQYQKQLEDIKSQINKSGNKSAIKLLEKIIQKETKSQANGFIKKTKSESSSDDLMLSCALCHEKMRVGDLASHSKVCSSKDTGKQPTTPTTPGTDMLRVTVTSSETDEKNATFKVVTKTTHEDYKFSDYEVHRSEGDFEWLQSALEEACPERIVPPMVSHSSLHGKMREVQRFLSRICAHKILRKHPLLNLFLTGEGQDVQKAREELDKRKRKVTNTAEKTLKQEPCDQNAPVIKCQRYLEKFAANLDGLITHLEDSLNKNTVDGPGFWFKSLAEFEPADTYLKVATEALSKICIELENNRETAEEKLIVNDLKSVHHYVKSAEVLLQRVQTAVEMFLYWDEEVRNYEQMKNPGSDEENPDHGSQTQKWAEANSNCADAKTNLEFLCKDLSSELAHFDWRKEVELREILIEYSELRSEHFEKVQSKWFGVKLMVEAPIAAEVRAIKCVEDS